MLTRGLQVADDELRKHPASESSREHGASRVVDLVVEEIGHQSDGSTPAVGGASREATPWSVIWFEPRLSFLSLSKKKGAEAM